jgi:thymidylate synthase
MSTSHTQSPFDSTQQGSNAHKLSPTSLAYNQALLFVLNHGVLVGPRGKMTLEVENYHFDVDHPDSNPIVTFDKKRNEVIDDYTRKEMDLYNSLSDRVEDFAIASKFWKTIANPDGTINSAYGSLIWAKKSCGNPQMSTWLKYGLRPEGLEPEEAHQDPDCQYMTPWEWAKQSLIKDQHTRQAFLRFSLPEHQWNGNKDQVCTMHGLFLIRRLELNFSVVMRSNDLILGLVYDLPFFIHIMERMVGELQSTYPGLKVGRYHHLSHSLHIYENAIPRAISMARWP